MRLANKTTGFIWDVKSRYGVNRKVWDINNDPVPWVLHRLVEYNFIRIGRQSASKFNFEKLEGAMTLGYCLSVGKFYVFAGIEVDVLWI